MERTLAVAVGAWGLAALYAAVGGVFAKLPLEWLIALSAFAAAFALGAFHLDAELNRYLEQAAWLLPAAVALGVLAAIALAASPWFALTFAVPLALTATAALLERAAFRSRAVKSPAATRAAT
jgi:hypothetical protein